MADLRTRHVVAAVAIAVGVAGCGGGAQTPSASPTPKPKPAEFHSGQCNLVSDDEVAALGGPGRFDKVVVNEAGCFWQENTMIGTVGTGMGISTWWYRGSDLDIERTLEQKAGREIKELSVHGNGGFEASDANVCSVYVAKDSDVITWSIQTLNPSRLPALCSVVERLAQLSQDRVN
jgi:hypothetical protein